MRNSDPVTMQKLAGEFVNFIEENNLNDLKDQELTDEQINKTFLKAHIQFYVYFSCSSYKHQNSKKR